MDVVSDVNDILGDPSAERAVLAGICRYNAEAYFDVADITSVKTFVIDSNAIIYKCLRHIFEKDSEAIIDVPTIYSAAKEIGVSEVLERQSEAKHLKSILAMPVALANVRKFAAKIRKLEIARLYCVSLESARDKMLQLRGDESVAEIVSIPENAILDLSSLIDQKDNTPKLLFEDIESYIQYLLDNPVQQIGIPTPYPIFNRSIGGGLRGGTINVIGARPKTGKTVLADNIGIHISKVLQIPVLNLDTEMNDEDHKHRILALLSEVSIDDIETGQFGKSESKKNKVLNIVDTVKEKKVPYHYMPIPGMPFEEQLAIMRRWLLREVGLNDDGKAKPCVIIYDYIKLMSADGLENLQEFQALGFLMTSLHNFAARYKVPILAFMQLNRDGITKESTDAASGSDRIIWLCSNFSIYKRKSDEEIAEDGPDAGNRKMVPVIARHGGGLDDGDYINMYMRGEFAQIVEGKTKFELANSDNDEGFIVNDDDQNIPFD